MPVIRPSVLLPADQRQHLVEQLADELAVEGEAGREPLVFENPIQKTDQFFAIVVWSAWKDVPWSLRSPMVADAYRRYDEKHPDAPRAARLAISSGLTWDEADANGMFPFAILPNARPGDADFQQVRDLMLQEGGFDTPSGVKLRFMTQDQAQRAWERLQNALPQAHWSINRFVANVSGD